MSGSSSSTTPVVRGDSSGSAKLTVRRLPEGEDSKIIRRANSTIIYPETVEDKERVRSAVFGTFFVRDHKPWTNYDDIDCRDRDLNCPLMIMQLRWDGRFGFVGGFMERREGPMDTLLREMREEIGYTGSAEGFKHITSHYQLMERDTKPGVAYTRESLYTHFYAKEVTLEEFRSIEQMALAARDHGTEVLGTVRVPLFMSRVQGKGFPVFLKNSFPVSVVEELVYLLATERLLPLVMLQSALSVAGLDFRTVLQDDALYLALEQEKKGSPRVTQ